MRARPAGRPGRLNLLDKVIGLVAPRTALKRAVARGGLDAVRDYAGAALGRRTDGWRAPRTSADAENWHAMTTLRNRSRDLTRNNPHVKKALGSWVNNLVGSGIVPRAATGNRAFDDKVDALFLRWSPNADAEGQLDFYGLQQLLVRQMIESGEVLMRRRMRRAADKLDVPLQLQLLEADHLDEFRVAYLGSTVGQIVNGVELDPLGRRRAYWLYPVHPGNSFIFPSPSILSVPVPADQVLHLYRKDRTQVRGVPWSHAIIRRARDLDDYDDAELTRKKIEACIVGFVEGPDASEGMAPPPAAGNAVTDNAGLPVELFQPGMIARIADGRKITFNNPQVAGGYPESVAVGLHAVAAGMEMPYELLTSDLSQVNFSSARVGLVEFRRHCTAIQDLCIIPMALQPIWDWFTAAAYLAGEIDRMVVPCKWEAPAFESVNPIVDINADVLAVRAGFDSQTAVIARRTGRNPAVVIAEIKTERDLADKLGLIFDSDAGKVARTGVEQPSEAGGDTPPTAPPAVPAPRPAPPARLIGFSKSPDKPAGGDPAPAGGDVSPPGGGAAPAAAAAAEQPPPVVVNVVLPKKGVEVTRVTKHDDQGRIQEFEREEREAG
jgi:lambda family phage portal protein